MKLFLYVLLFAVTTQPARAQKDPLSAHRITGWSNDLELLQKDILRIHPNPYHAISKTALDSSFADIKSHLSSWSDNKIITEITRAVSSLNEGHSFVHQTITDSAKYFMFHYFPIQAFVFPDGIYVINAAPEYRAMIGKKIISIGGYPIEQVEKLMIPLINRDEQNMYAVKNNMPFMITIAEYLNGLGITGSSAEIIYRVAGEDKIAESYTMKSVSFTAYQQVFHRADAIPAELPLYRHDRLKYYWYTYIHQKKTLYIKYNSELIDPKDSLTAFCRRMQKLIDTAEVDKTIIDLRDNQGGDAGTIQPMINFLTGNKKINRRGKLYMIIGRRTQSAGAIFAVRMELNSDAILVGEPTLTRSAFYSDARYTTLPNSKLRVGIASLLFNSGFREDNRNTIEPDVMIAMSATDFFKGTDPVLNYVLDTRDTANNNDKMKDGAEGISGKYCYNVLQTAFVTKDENGDVWLRIEDLAARNLLNTRLYKTQTDTYNTDIRTPKKIRFNKKSLVLKMPWGDMTLAKLNNDAFSLRQLAASEKYNEVADTLLLLWKHSSAAEKSLFERYINSAGYNALRKNRHPEAIRLFRLNTEFFPQSSNAYDSLAEAYLASDDTARAISYYKKSLELNPDNDGAKKALATLNAHL